MVVMIILDIKRSNKMKINISDDTIIETDILPFETLDFDGNIVTSFIELNKNRPIDEEKYNNSDQDHFIHENITISNNEMSTDSLNSTDSCKIFNNNSSLNKNHENILENNDNSDKDSYSSRSSYTYSNELSDNENENKNNINNENNDENNDENSECSNSFV